MCNILHEMLEIDEMFGNVEKHIKYQETHEIL